jgi:hypothetical protein
VTINYEFGFVNAHGATIRAQPAALEAEHQAIIRDVLAASDSRGVAGSTACNAHGSKVQTAGSNIASTCSAVGSSWA